MFGVGGGDLQLWDFVWSCLFDCSVVLLVLFGCFIVFFVFVLQYMWYDSRKLYCMNSV